MTAQRTIAKLRKENTELKEANEKFLETVSKSRRESVEKKEREE